MQALKFQLGKNGVTEGTIETLKNYFKNNKIVRIYLLKNAAESREKIDEVAQKIVKDLGGNFVYKTIGFTIIMRRVAKDRFKNSGKK